MTHITVRARKSRVSRRLTILLIAGSVPAVLPAHAADVVVKTSVSQEFRFNDNYDLVSNSPGAVFLSRTNLSASIVAQVPTFVIGANVAFPYDVYAGPGRGRRESGINFPSLNFNATKSLKNTTFTAFGSFSIDDTATTQLEDTGIIDINADQFTSNLTAGVSRNINPNNIVSINIDATSVSFSDDAGQFTPYTDVNVIGQWTHLVNSRIETGATSTIGFYQDDGPSDRRTLVFRANGNAAVRLTKSFSVNGAAGVSLSSFDGSGSASASSSMSGGFSGRFSANYQEKRTGYGLSISQSLEN